MQYLVVVRTESTELGGTPTTGLALAENNGTGEEYLKEYLEKRMPAGSPVTISKVVTIDSSPSWAKVIHLDDAS